MVALVLVDVQRNMLEPPAPVPAAAEVSRVIAELLIRARASGAGVVHVRNTGGDGDPDQPGTPGWELVHDVRPGEHVIDKTTCDAFAGTSLGALLPPSTPLVVVGMQSEYCVRETALAAVGRGHPVQLVRGGHATYDGAKAAAVTSREIEAELIDAGVAVVEPDAVRFD